MDEGFEIVEYLNGSVVNRGLDYVINTLMTYNTRHSATHTDLRVFLDVRDESSRLLLIGKPIPPKK